MTELPNPIDPTNLQAEYFVEEIIEAFNMLLHYAAEQSGQRWDGADWVLITPTHPIKHPSKTNDGGSDE